MIHPQNKMSLEGEPAAWKGSIPTREGPGSSTGAWEMQQQNPTQEFPFNPSEAAQLLKRTPSFTQRLVQHRASKAERKRRIFPARAASLQLAQKLSCVHQHKRVTPPAPTATLTPKRAVGKRQEDPGHRRKQQSSTRDAVADLRQVRGSRSHRWERLALGRRCRREMSAGSADRPAYSQSFCFPSRGFSSAKSEDGSQLPQHPEPGGGRSCPCTARHEDIPIPQLLWKALPRLTFHTLRLQSI